METLKQLKKNPFGFAVFFVLMFIFSHGNAQTAIKISDARNVIVSTGTYFKIPGNISVGNGTSGTLKIDGTNVTTSGQLNLNAGSELHLSSGIFSAASVSINSASTVVYDGTDQNIKNWAYGNLVINGNGTKSVTGDATTPTVCNNLTVNNTGNILSIPENKALTVQSTLSNNAGVDGISVESSLSGDGSLISYTSNVDATVNRYLTGTCWHYISSPIDGAPLSLFNTNNFMWWDASMDWAGTGDYNPWQGYTGTNLLNAHGYAYYYYETTIPFQGKINVDDYTVTLYMYNSGDLDFQGWNMIGNPYTSVLDWDAAVSGGAVPAGAEDAIYYFDDDDGSGSQANYRYYVPSSGGTYGIGTGDANGKIPVGQGFFIKTNTDNVNLILNKSYRTHAVQEFYKSPLNDFLKVQISGSKSDETIARIIENSTFGFDPNFDARKLFPANENFPQIYIIGTDLKKTAINSLPEIKPNTIIQLGIFAQEGDYSINLKDYNFDRYDVYLVDNETVSYVNLNTEECYQFHHSGEYDNERFYLTFQSQTSGVTDNLSNNITVYPNPTSQFIKFANHSNTEFESIKIHSANGKVCYLNTQAKSVNKIDLSQFSNGVYFLEIKLSDGNTYRNRIILNK